MIAISDLEAFLQQDLSDYQVEAQAACDQASAVVQDYCKRSFALVEDDVLTMRWRPSIVLPDPPVTQISSFEIDGEAAPYEIDESGRLWPMARGEEIVITYTHGFATIPETPRLVAIRLASRIFKNPTGKVSYSADTMNYQGVSDVSPRILTGDEMATLNRRYRLKRAQ